MKASDLMSSNVETVTMDTPLSEIWGLFREHRFHHVPVVDENSKLVGMISDRDVLFHISPRVESGNATVAELEVLRKPAHQFMSRGPLTVYPNTSVSRVLRTIIEQSVSCLPVVDDELNLLGILTWRDVIRFVVKRADGKAKSKSSESSAVESSERVETAETVESTEPVESSSVNEGSATSEIPEVDDTSMESMIEDEMKADDSDL